MRKMFSEKQLKEMTVANVNEAITSKQIDVGTKLYKHNFSIIGDDDNDDEYSLSIVFLSTTSESLTTLDDFNNEEFVFIQLFFNDFTNEAMGYIYDFIYTPDYFHIGYIPNANNSHIEISLISITSVFDNVVKL